MVPAKEDGFACCWVEGEIQTPARVFFFLNGYTFLCHAAALWVLQGLQWGQGLVTSGMSPVLRQHLSLGSQCLERQRRGADSTVPD